MGDYQQRERANEELAITENAINLENEGTMSKNNVNPEVPRSRLFRRTHRLYTRLRSTTVIIGCSL